MSFNVWEPIWHGIEGILTAARLILFVELTHRIVGAVVGDITVVSATRKQAHDVFPRLFVVDPRNHLLPGRIQDGAVTEVSFEPDARVQVGSHLPHAGTFPKVELVGEVDGGHSQHVGPIRPWAEMDGDPRRVVPSVGSVLPRLRAFPFQVRVYLLLVNEINFIDFRVESRRAKDRLKKLIR